MSSTKFLVLFFVYCSLQVSVLCDTISVGVTTSCTKLDGDGDVEEFTCPDSFNILNHYCCGLRNFQYCCDYDTYESYRNLSAGVIAAIVIGSIIIFAGFILLLCCCCSCCCLAQRRQRGVILAQPFATTTSTTVLQPLFAQQGYNQMPPQSTSSGGGQQATMAKPPPYYEP